jgi:iron complex outermembrane receptor protein
MNADNWTVYANVNYDFDFGILTWVPSYRYIDYYLVQTASPSFAYAPAVHDDLDSQELRFSSEPDSPITWVGGLYYGRQWSQEQNYFLTGAEPYITVSEPGFPTITHVYFKNDVDRYVYESKSAFGQATAPVPFLDGLRVVGGLRYTMDHKDYQGNTGAVLAGPTLFDVPVAATESLYRITYKAGLEYDLTPQILTYANVSTGFKAGGANGKPPGSSIPAVFGPEKNTAYQAGIKSRFWDNRGQINAEAFYYDYDGYQTSAFAEYKGVAIGYNVNSQTARMYGGEVEGTFLLTPDDRIAPSISLLSAKYIDFFIPATGINLSGKPMQNAPGFTFTTNYTHTFQLASGADIAAHVDAHYEGGQWVDYRLSPGSHQDGFWRADADLTYDSPDGKWSLTAYCHNLSNDGSINTANGGLGAYEIAIPYPPRTYGLRVTANF